MALLGMTFIVLDLLALILSLTFLVMGFIKKGKWFKYSAISFASFTLLFISTLVLASIDINNQEKEKAAVSAQIKETEEYEDYLNDQTSDGDYDVEASSEDDVSGDSTDDSSDDEFNDEFDEEIESDIYKDTINEIIKSNDYSSVSIKKVVLNENMGADEEEDLIALIYLIQTGKPRVKTLQNLIDLYSEDLAAHLAKEDERVVELNIFWYNSYAASNSNLAADAIIAKKQFERVPKGFAFRDSVFNPQVFN
ncbi:hypothetical protein [Rummeliibacillus stabekisii]|uniref:Uncharacterized protein n=1 Tax=Rummeliibacillus stabekisii TaxID=241244 RepID=A0A143H9R5_9BACL|nr:hypothetical protein [Rummeliibacillus stabekisii]AMW98477.1 hypothetical protein ATY39_02910 [Rummeliibacillus stabekisii]